ncbi:FG-GAP repeat domain-containing protein [Streptomyces sp. NPDC048330]|uniref:FG-GAP repeat domain-containing protein n=1 Tax=Streptomyces sp. NPDC048330 TaxID=3365533 RepID=UPI0037139C05
MTPGTTRLRLTAAVVTVLAITAGAAFTAAPAGAAPVTGTVSAAPAADPRPGYVLGANVDVVSWGRSGFLGSTSRSLYPEGVETVYRWYRADGTSTFLERSVEGEQTMTGDLGGSDIVTKKSYVSGSTLIELRDMAAPAGTAPVVFDLTARGSGYTYLATASFGILVEVGPTNGPKELRLLTKSGATVSERKVTGVPATFGSAVGGVAGTPDAAVLSYYPVREGGKTGVVVVDLTAGAVTRAYAPLPSGPDEYQRATASSTKLAVWRGADLVVTDRATGTDTSITVGRPTAPALVGLLGDWVAYGTRTGPYAHQDGPLQQFTARSLADGRTVGLLDSATGEVVRAPDGTLLVEGRTAAKGEGVYRIAPGADGTPAAELVFATGESAPLAVLSTDFAPVLDLDAARYGQLGMEWSLSHGAFSYTLEMVHRQTGERFVHTGRNDPYSYGKLAFSWDAASAPYGSNTAKDPFNGDYTWNLTVKPDNGVGPDVHATGEVKVVRKPTMHDFNDNGSPDVLFRDSLGYLRATDTTYDTRTGKVVPTRTHETMGWGWNGYKLIESVGDIAGTNAPDVVGRDAAGVLWLHPGTGSETNAPTPRVRIGAGWNIYNRLAGGSDVTGDGRADVLATDTAGVMWLYKGTGKATAPLADRVRLGAGWNIYDQITAVGDIAGAPAGDFVARDKAGVLWLYLGKGNGTFATRSRIGAGWNQYSRLVGIGDATGDGRADLYAYGPYNTSYVYAGTGSWSSPVAGRRPTDLLLNTEAPVNHVT